MLCKSLQALGCQDKATNTQKSSKNKTSETPLFHDSLLMRPALLSKKGCPKTFCLDVIQSFQSTSSNLSVNMAPNVCSKCQWYILRPCRGSFGISFLSAVRFVPTSLGASAPSAAPQLGCPRSCEPAGDIARTRCKLSRITSGSVCHWGLLQNSIKFVYVP